MVKNRRTRKGDRGAAAVEFAIVLPLFLVLVLGTIDFGYFFFVTEVMTNAAREGARAGSVADASVRDPYADASKVAGDYIKAAGLQTRVKKVDPVSTGVVSGGDSIQVEVTYYAQSLTGLFTDLFKIFASDGTRRVTAVMRFE